MKMRLPDPKQLCMAFFLICAVCTAGLPAVSHAANWVHVGTFVDAKGVSTDEYYATETVQPFALGSIALVRENVEGQPPEYFQVAIDCRDHEFKFRRVLLMTKGKPLFGPVIGPKNIVEGSDAAELELYLCAA